MESAKDRLDRAKNRSLLPAAVTRSRHHIAGRERVESDHAWRDFLDLPSAVDTRRFCRYHHYYSSGV
jgi:hypothetical protein